MTEEVNTETVTSVPKLEYTFKQNEWLEQALTHKSFRNETQEVEFDNERLEFLGDAVLDLALSELLMETFPGDQEGPLSKKRASLVNEEQLCELAREMGLDQVLRLGKGEKQSGGLQKPRLLASGLEAIFGAVFTDGGYPAAQELVRRLFTPLMTSFNEGGAPFARDFKTRLQELMQEKYKQTPSYTVEREEGPDHEKTFAVSVRIGTQILAEGVGRSKKASEQDAARRALDAFDATLALEAKEMEPEK